GERQGRLRRDEFRRVPRSRGGFLSPPLVGAYLQSDPRRLRGRRDRRAAERRAEIPLDRGLGRRQPGSRYADLRLLRRAAVLDVGSFGQECRGQQASPAARFRSCGNGDDKRSRSLHFVSRSTHFAILRESGGSGSTRTTPLDARPPPILLSSRRMTPVGVNLTAQVRQ